MQVIVEEAGGRFSDRNGERRIDSGSAVASNGLIHDELLAAVPVAGRPRRRAGCAAYVCDG